MRISVDGENIPILGGSEKEEFSKIRLRRSEHWDRMKIRKVWSSESKKKSVPRNGDELIE